MSGAVWWLLGVGGPLLILAVAAVVGAAHERKARLDADPGPWRVLHRGWYSRLGIDVGDRRVERRLGLLDRARQRTLELKRRFRP